MICKFPGVSLAGVVRFASCNIARPWGRFVSVSGKTLPSFSLLFFFFSPLPSLFLSGGLCGLINSDQSSTFETLSIVKVFLWIIGHWELEPLGALLAEDVSLAACVIWSLFIPVCKICSMEEKAPRKTWILWVFCIKYPGIWQCASGWEREFWEMTFLRSVKWSIWGGFQTLVGGLFFFFFRLSFCEHCGECSFPISLLQGCLTAGDEISHLAPLGEAV